MDYRKGSRSTRESSKSSEHNVYSLKDSMIGLGGGN